MVDMITIEGNEFKPWAQRAQSRDRWLWSYLLMARSWMTAIVGTEDAELEVIRKGFSISFGSSRVRQSWNEKSNQKLSMTPHCELPATGCIERNVGGRL